MYDGTLSPLTNASAYNGAHFISNVCRNWKSAQRKMYVLLAILSAINTGMGLGQRHRIIPHAALNAVNSYFVQMSSAKGEHMTQNSYKICKGWTFQV